MSSLRLVILDWFAPHPVVRCPVSTAVRLVLFTVLLLLCYPAAWLVVDLSKGGLTSLLAGTIRFLAPVLADYPMRFWTTGTEVHFAITRGRGFEAWLQTEPIFANLPILVALVAVTPAVGWRRRLVTVVGATALLFATHVCFLWIKVQVTLIAAGHAYAGSTELWQTLDDVFEVTGKTAFPVLIWLLVAFPYFLGAVDLRPPKTPPVLSRNAPCPCGSGKKYKACCGR